MGKIYFLVVFGSLLTPEDGGRMFMLNVSKLMP
jgi:hypothetical protein